MAAAPTPVRAAVHTPATFLINGFIIETYPAMVQVPYASVSDQRGKAAKTSEHERFDELYGRCRTCMGYKSGEQLLLCDDCDRGFHMTCLVPPLREVPKGEWHCAKCTRDRRHTFHRRATAVATLRRVLDDVDRRPTLPPRLKLKFLDLPAPTVRYTRIPLSTKSVSEQLQNDPPPPHPHVMRHAKTLPPKCRQKQSFTLGTPGEGPEVQESSTLYSKVTGESIRRSRKHFFRFLGDLAPVVRVRKDAEALKSLQDVRGILSDVPNEFPRDEFVETRTSDNSPSKHAKRARTTAYEDGALLVQSISENSNPPRENGTTNGVLCDKGSTNSHDDANTTSDPAGAQTDDERKQRTE